MKTVLGVILASNIRKLTKGKSRSSKIYLVKDDDGNLFLETGMTCKDNNEYCIVSILL